MAEASNLSSKSFEPGFNKESTPTFHARICSLAFEQSLVLEAAVPYP